MCFTEKCSLNATNQRNSFICRRSIWSHIELEAIIILLFAKFLSFHVELINFIRLKHTLIHKKSLRVINMKNGDLYLKINFFFWMESKKCNYKKDQWALWRREKKTLPPALFMNIHLYWALYNYEINKPCSQDKEVICHYLLMYSIQMFFNLYCINHQPSK